MKSTFNLLEKEKMKYKGRKTSKWRSIILRDHRRRKKAKVEEIMNNEQFLNLITYLFYHL
jgi:hypothetical protein